MLESIKPYFQPKSLTWWSGISMISVGSALMAGLNHPAWGQVALLLNLMTGNNGAVVPAQLVMVGLGFIGIRAKLDRMAS